MDIFKVTVFRKHRPASIVAVAPNISTAVSIVNTGLSLYSWYKGLGQITSVEKLKDTESMIISDEGADDDIPF